MVTPSCASVAGTLRCLELCAGELQEEHIGVNAALLEAGNHAGATFEELVAFTRAVRSGSAPEVSLRDGAMAALMGLAAHRSISSGQPVLWKNMLAEYEEALASASQVA